MVISHLVFALAISVRPVRLHTFLARKTSPVSGHLSFNKTNRQESKITRIPKINAIASHMTLNLSVFKHLRHTGHVPAPIGVAVAAGIRSAGGVA